MTNNIKLSARKTSFILAVSCILFSVIATYLYINHQIDLTRYTTPIILGTVVIIITCGGLQRVFYIFLTDECPQIFSDNQRNSIPDKVIPKPDMIIEECSEPTVEVSDIEMIEVSNATEVISMIELPEKTKNTDTKKKLSALKSLHPLQYQNSMMIRKKSKFWSNNLLQKLNPKLFHISRDSKAVWKKFRRKN